MLRKETRLKSTCLKRRRTAEDEDGEEDPEEAAAGGAEDAPMPSKVEELTEELNV
jgi:hypothetical protein